jgi:cytochrome c-type biogenesis protein CcmE
VELTPRTGPGVADDDLGPADEGTDQPRRARTRSSGRRRWLPLAVLAVVVLAIGFFVVRGLSDATMYFRNADEAVAERDELGTKRFRLQGTVVGDPEPAGGDTVRFDVAYEGVSVAVRHAGDPPELFRPGVPVVLEGSWSATDDVFDSDRILVKHDESYESQDDYDDRVRQAETNGTEPVEAGPGAPADGAAPDGSGASGGSGASSGSDAGGG